LTVREQDRRDQIMAEDHNGWKNRETWQANLWLGNDERLYSHALDIVTGAEDAREAAEDLQALLADELGEGRPGLMGDVIGLWLARVDWDGIASTWMEDAR